MRSTRSVVAVVLGAILIALGAFVAVRPLWTRVPLTGSRLLDGAFALVFLVRGWMSLRRAQRARGNQ